MENKSTFYVTVVLALLIGNSPLTSGESSDSDIKIYFTEISGHKLYKVNSCDVDAGFIAICEIPTSSFSDKPTMTAALSDGGASTLLEGVDKSDVYLFKYKMVPKGLGNITVTCTATDSKSPGNTKTASKDTAVADPEPQITVTTSDKGFLMPTVAKVSGTWSIRCSDNTKVPTSTTNFTVSCLGQTQTTVGRDASLTFKDVGPEADQKACQCEVGCQNWSTQVTLDAEYSPVFNSFEGNGQLDNVTLKFGDSVTLVCDVMAKPMAKSISVKGQRSGESIKENFYSDAKPHSKRSTRDAKVISTYKDTGAYTCTAANGIGQPSTKTFYVLVERAPQFQPSFKDGEKTFLGAYVSKALEVKVPIEGYPAPTSYNLTLDQGGKRTPVKHGLHYVAEQPDQGIVVLSLHVSEKEGATQRYVLGVDNGIGNTLYYKFTVDTSDDGLSAGAKAGIGIGVTLAVIVVCVVAFVVYRKHKSSGYSYGR